MAARTARGAPLGCSACVADFLWPLAPLACRLAAASVCSCLPLSCVCVCVCEARGCLGRVFGVAACLAWALRWRAALGTGVLGRSLCCAWRLWPPSVLPVPCLRWRGYWLLEPWEMAPPGQCSRFPPFIVAVLARAVAARAVCGAGGCAVCCLCTRLRQHSLWLLECVCACLRAWLMVAWAARAVWLSAPLVLCARLCCWRTRWRRAARLLSLLPVQRL